SCPNPPPSSLYTLPLHDALPISRGRFARRDVVEKLQERIEPLGDVAALPALVLAGAEQLIGDLERRQRERGHRIPHARGLERAQDRKSTRLNSSHVSISYAVFCL